MKINTVLAISIFLILSVLFATCIFFLFMRQNQMARQLDSGIENLKSSIPVTKSNPNTVENAEFSKFERDLRDSNNKWLWGWTAFFTTIVAVVLAIIGVALWFSVQSLIADRVGKYITEFKEDVGQLDKVKDQLRMLEYKYTNNLLKGIPESYFRTESILHFEQIKELRDEALLQVLDNKESLLGAKYRAASVLASRNSSLLVSSTLKYLNSIIDSDLSGDPILSYDPRYYLCEMVGFVGQIYTQEAYKGLKKYLNFLLTRSPKNKDLLLDWTVYSLASISVEMNQKDSIPILRKSIPDLKLISSEYEALETLAWHFDILNEPAGIKDILNYHAAGKNSALQDKCLELLQKHDPEFVKEYQAQNVNTNTESEDSL